MRTGAGGISLGWGCALLLQGCAVWLLLLARHRGEEREGYRHSALNPVAGR